MSMLNNQSGVLRLFIEKAVKLPKGLFGSLTSIDPYIKIRFDNDNHIVARGKVKEKTGYDPIFNESFDLPLTGRERGIRIEIWDENVLKNTELASVFLSLDDLVNRTRSHSDWFVLQSKSGNAGEILVRGELENRGMQQQSSSMGMGMGSRNDMVNDRNVGMGSNMSGNSGYGNSGYGNSGYGSTMGSSNTGYGNTMGMGSNVPSNSGIARGEHIPNEPLSNLQTRGFQQK
jgi:hypothetical protein